MYKGRKKQKEKFRSCTVARGGGGGGGSFKTDLPRTWRGERRQCILHRVKGSRPLGFAYRDFVVDLWIPDHVEFICCVDPTYRIFRNLSRLKDKNKI